MAERTVEGPDPADQDAAPDDAGSSPAAGGRTGFRYDAFISYNRGTDARIAEALQKGVENVARRPLRRGRPLEVFRDLTDMQVGDLGQGIRSALDESAYLILLANQKSARAEWVNLEVEHWIGAGQDDDVRLADRLGRLLVVRTSDGPLRDVLPAVLHGYLEQNPVRFQPAWVDLAWARADELLDLDNLRFQQTAAEVAGRLLGTRRRAIFDLHERSVRRTRRGVRAGIIGLVAALLASAVLAIWANDLRASAVAERERADDQHGQALARQLAAESALLALYDPPVARDLALLSLQMRPGAPPVEALAAASMATRLPVARTGDYSIDKPGQDGQLALVYSRQGISIWDRDRRVFVPSSIYAAEVAVGPTGDRFATASAEIVTLWDARSPHRPARIASSERLERSVQSMAFSRDGSRLAAVDDMGAVTVWDVTDAVADRALRDPVRATPDALPAVPRRLFHVSLSAAGDQVVTTSDDGVLYWWDLSDRARPRLVGDRWLDAMETFAVSPTGGGQLLVAGVRKREVNVLLISADGTELHLTLPDNTVTPSEDDVPRYDDRAPFVAVDPAGELVALTDYSGRLRVWDVADPDSPVVTSVLASAAVSGLRFTASGRTILGVTAENGLLSFAVDPPARRRVLAGAAGHPGAQEAIVVGPAGTLTVLPLDGAAPPAGPGLASVPLSGAGGQSGVGEQRDVDAGLGAVPSDPAPVVAVAAEAGVAFLADDDDDTALWTTAGTPVARWRGKLPARGLEHSVSPPYNGADQVDAAALSADGTLLATSRLGRVRLWDVPPADRAGQPPTDRSLLLAAPSGTPGGQAADDVALAISPDNGLLAVHGNRTTLWDITDPARPRTVLELKPTRVSSRRPSSDVQRVSLAPVAFSADGALFAAAGREGAITVWNVADPKRPAELGTLLGHAGDIQALAFRGDGRMLASAGADRTVRLWEVSPHSVSLTPGLLAADSGDVRFLTFPGAGDRLVAGAANRGLQAWDLDPSRLRTRLCADLTRPLPDDLLRRYTDDLISRHPCA